MKAAVDILTTPIELFDRIVPSQSFSSFYDIKVRKLQLIRQKVFISQDFDRWYLMDRKQLQSTVESQLRSRDTLEIAMLKTRDLNLSVEFFNRYDDNKLYWLWNDLGDYGYPAIRLAVANRLVKDIDYYRMFLACDSVKYVHLTNEILKLVNSDNYYAISKRLADCDALLKWFYELTPDLSNTYQLLIVMRLYDLFHTYGKEDILLDRIFVHILGNTKNAKDVINILVKKGYTSDKLVRLINRNYDSLKHTEEGSTTVRNIIKELS